MGICIILYVPEVGPDCILSIFGLVYKSSISLICVYGGSGSLTVLDPGYILYNCAVIKYK